MYRKGLGVLPDGTRAYMWFTIAISNLDGVERDDVREVRDGLSAGMSKEAIERGETLAREWKPGDAAAQAPEDGPGDLALRAVNLDDYLWVIDMMFARGTKGTLQLGKEKITGENWKDARERLRGERKQVAGEIDRVGSRDVRGDYELLQAAGDPCGLAKASKEKSFDLQSP